MKPVHWAGTNMASTLDRLLA